MVMNTCLNFHCTYLEYLRWAISGVHREGIRSSIVSCHFVHIQPSHTLCTLQIFTNMEGFSITRKLSHPFELTRIECFASSYYMGKKTKYQFTMLISIQRFLSLRSLSLWIRLTRIGMIHLRDYLSFPSDWTSSKYTFLIGNFDQLVSPISSPLPAPSSWRLSRSVRTHKSPTEEGMCPKCKQTRYVTAIFPRDEK